MSGYQDSNLGPPAPKAGALTGLRYIPNNKFIGLLTFSRKRCKGTTIFLTTKTFRRKFYIKIKKNIYYKIIPYKSNDYHFKNHYQNTKSLFKEWKYKLYSEKISTFAQKKRIKKILVLQKTGDKID